MTEPRRRLDVELVRLGLAGSRTRAGALIAAGQVSVDGVTVTKPSIPVGLDADIGVTGAATAAPVSRAGHKLDGALDELGITVAGRRCLDAGASTGGFTEALLRRGAAAVASVDVGHGQLVDQLRQDDRVLVLEGFNVRTLDVADIGGPVELTVADLSFISLTLVLPALTAATRPEGDLLLLVKPQFEVGRARLGRGGVVRSPQDRGEAIEAVAAGAHGLGWGTRAVARSVLPGPAGNVEFFLWLRRDAPILDRRALPELG